jgi:hypothetical protein
VHVYEYSGEEYEHVTSEISIPVIARTGPDFRARSAFQKLGEALTLYQSHFRGPPDRPDGREGVDRQPDALLRADGR